MDFLVELSQEKDYDIMCEKLMSRENVGCVSLLFPSYNVKILLTAFMIKNFPDVYPDKELQECAETVCQALTNLDHLNMSKIYAKYFEIFTKWRQNDIKNLKTSIELQKETLNTMKEEDPSDEADQQWNDGISQNVETLEKHLKKLENYAQSPPIRIPHDT